jgi:hypothetical protein
MKVKPANAGASVKASGVKKTNTPAKARGGKKPALARGGIMQVMGQEKPAMARGGMPKKYSRKK